MKKALILLVSILCIYIPNCFGQNVHVVVTPPTPVKAFIENQFKLNITVDNPISIPSGQKLYLGISIDTSEKVITTTHLIHPSGIILIEIGDGSSGIDSVFYKLKIKCEAEYNNSISTTPDYTYSDVVSMYIGSPGSGYTPYSSYEFNGPLSSTGTINYIWESASFFNDPFFENLNVDYIDILNGDTIRRIIKYYNNSYDFNGLLHFEDSVKCLYVNFKSLKIVIDGLTVYSDTFPDSTTYISTGAFHHYVGAGDSIIIEEIFSFPNYLTHCPGDCSIRNFDTNLRWGHDSIGGVIEDLCMSRRDNNNTYNLITSPKVPKLVIQRRTPIADSLNSFVPWDTTVTGTSVQWQFEVRNDSTDIIKNVSIKIYNGFPASSFYYLPDSLDLVVQLDGDTLNSFTPHQLTTTYFTDTSGRKPYCLENNYPNSICAVEYRIPLLLPGQTVDITFPLIYCCPSNDDGGINSVNGYSVFDIPKSLNSWIIEVKGRDECFNSLDLPLYSFNDTANSLYMTHPNISTNDPTDAEHIYLSQHYTPTHTELDVAVNPGCSPFKTFELTNFEFNLTSMHSRVLNSNIFSPNYNISNPSSMIVPDAIIRYVFELMPGIKLSLNDSDFVFRNQLGTKFWPGTVSLLNSPGCNDSSIYIVDFNIDDFDFGNHSFIDFNNFMNNSVLEFDMSGCCCAISNESNNPEYKIKTYISGRDEDCFIPLCLQEGHVNIHCPGCEVPGLIVESGSIVLDRIESSFGNEDENNDGLLNGGQIDSTYSRYNSVKRNRSMFGDDLITTVKANISQGAISLQQLKDSFNVNLNHLYLEIKIPNSDENKFNLTVNQIDLIFSRNGIDSFFTVTPANFSIWNLILHDIHSPLNPTDDLFFLNIGTDVLCSLNIVSCPFEFLENDEFEIRLHYTVCQNFINNPGSLQIDQNEWHSDVELNMYLTEEDLASIYIFDAYSSSLRPIADEQWKDSLLPDTVNCNWLWVCETRSGPHNFYTILPFFKAEVSEGGATKCQKTLSINTEVHVGGELSNVFPYEFRGITDSLTYNITLPTGSPLVFNTLTQNNITSSVRTFNEGSCFPFNFHSVRDSTPFAFPTSGSAILNFILTNAFQGLQSLYDTTICDLPFTNPSTNVFASDEYIKQNMSFPFYMEDCNSIDTLFLNKDSIFVDLNITSTCSTTTLLAYNLTSGNNSITPSNPHNFTGSIPDLLHVNSQIIEWDIELSNPPVSGINVGDAVEHPFIMIEDLGFMSNVTVSYGITTDTCQQIIVGGSPVFFMGLPNILYTETPTFTIRGNIDSCIADSLYINVSYGWNCGEYPDSIQLSNPSMICEFAQDSIKIMFATPGATITLNPKNSYTLCEADTIYSQIEPQGSDILNIVVVIECLDTAFANGLDTSSFIFHNSSGTFPHILNYDSINSIYSLSLINGQLSHSSYLDFIFTVTQTSASTSTPPFTITLSYDSYCGDSMANATDYDTWSDTGMCGLAVNIYNGNLLCPGDSTFLTASADTILGQHPTPPFQYTWTSSPSGFADTGSVVTVNPIVTTTYIVTATDANGTTGTASRIIEVIASAQCCIPSGFTDTLDYNFSDKTASEVIAEYFLINETINTYRTILINGTFTVDQDFTFAGCDNIILGPSALIDVDTSVTLSLLDSDVRSCNEMARGISTHLDSRVILHTTVIEDCQYAVYLRDNSRLTATTVSFNNNYVGIYTPPNSGIPSTAQIHIEDCEFMCTSNLKDSFIGQDPTPLNKSFAGIFVNDLGLLNISQYSDTFDNKFSGLNYGIYSKNSNIYGDLNNFDSTFSNILFYDYYTDNVNINTHGSAIYVEGSGAQSITLKGNADANSAIAFDNCKFGIYLKKMHSEITNNRFDCQNGIRTTLAGNFLFTTIQNNYITATRYGIELWNNNAPSQMLVKENIITTTLNNVSQMVGINVSNNNIPDLNSIIYHNLISQGYSEVSSTGIEVTYSNNVRIKRNFIYVDSASHPSEINRGISIIGSPFSYLNCNQVRGGSSSMIHNEQTAIYTNQSPGYNYKCNVTNSIHNGFLFEADNYDASINWSKLRSNDIVEHIYGLRLLDSSTTMGPQTHQGNTWLGNSYFIGALSGNPDAPLYDQYQYDAIPLFHAPDSVYPSFWFDADPGIDDAYCPGSEPNDYCDGVVIEPEPSIERILQIAEGDYHTPKYDEEVVYRLRRSVLKLLFKNEYIANYDQRITDFYNEYYGTENTMERLTNIQILLDTLYLQFADPFQETLTDLKLAIESEISLIVYNDSLFLNDTTLDNTELEALIESNKEHLNSIIVHDSTLKAETVLLEDEIQIKVTDILELNESISEDYIFESNEIMINKIFLNTIAVGIIPDSSTYASDLLNVALQCPVKGGPAVFHARSLYKFIDENQIFEDDRICISEGECLVPPRPDLIVLADGYTNLGLCGATLEISTTSNSATEYQWTLPSGVTINSDTTVDLIELTFNEEFIKGEVCVKGINECGIGPERCIVVYGRPGPILLESIYGESTACPEAILPYSWEAVTGATEYYVFTENIEDSIYDVPTENNGVLIKWSVLPGRIGFVASNNCGHSDTTYIEVAYCDTSEYEIPPDPRFKKPINYFSETVKIFPNPTNGHVKLLYKIANEKGELQLLNMLGNIVKTYSLEGNSNVFEFNTSDFNSGVLHYRVYDRDILIARGNLVIMK
jgi:hypothetical protein